MSGDENLAARIRPIMSGMQGLSEKRMFGGPLLLDQWKHVHRDMERLIGGTSRQGEARRDDGRALHEAF